MTLNEIDNRIKELKDELSNLNTERNELTKNVLTESEEDIFQKRMDAIKEWSDRIVNKNIQETQNKEILVKNVEKQTIEAAKEMQKMLVLLNRIYYGLAASGDVSKLDVLLIGNYNQFGAITRTPSEDNPAFISGFGILSSFTQKYCWDNAGYYNSYLERRVTSLHGQDAIQFMALFNDYKQFFYKTIDGWLGLDV